MYKIQSKYSGQCIAMINEKVVATGKNSIEAYTNAKQTHPTEMITLMCVPRKKEVTMFL